jgi:hypothetical protein
MRQITHTHVSQKIYDLLETADVYSP